MAQGSTNYTHLTKVSIDTALAYGTDENEVNIMNSAGAFTFPSTIIESTETTTTNGNIAALDSTKGCNYLNPTTTATIQGVLAGVDGQQLTLHNLSANSVTLSNQNGSATAANRLILSTTSATVLKAHSSAFLQYCGSLSRWLVLNVSQ